MDKNKQAISVYNKIAKTYSRKFSNHSEHIDEFLALIPKNGSIVDVGCGVGVDAEYMKSKNFDVIGIDFSKEMLKIAKQRFPQVKFRLHDFRKLNFKSDSFNGILASFSLIHIQKKDIPRTLKRFSKLLKIGGIIYLSFQAGRPREIFVNTPLDKNKKIFVDIVSYSEVKKRLVDSGFKILKMYTRKPANSELNFSKLFIIARK